ncbi:MAG: prolyl oligopeptidase family serine peptidase [Geobacter sp.]|nr:prolyl oligopeptidase family serine peptidase [Geobacter sp.]
MVSVEFKSKSTNTLLRGRFIKAGTDNGLSPVVIMLTGDGKKGSKSLSWVNMPPKLQEVGISSFLFDFEGLGYSEGERRTLSLSVGIDNFISSYEFLKQQEWVDTQRIGAFASSFGAAVVLLTPDIANQLKAIGLKSPAAFIPDAYFNEIGKHKFEEWRTNGYLEENGYNFDILLDSLKYNVFNSSFGIKAPCMITQGDNDEVIPLQHSLYLYECLGSKDKFIEVFENVSHGYSENNAWEKMARIFVDWFSKKL